MPKITRMTSESLDIIHIKTTLSINEAAIYADIGEDKVRQLVHTKDFPCFKNGNKWCINREMLNDWLKKISAEHRQI